MNLRHSPRLSPAFFVAVFALVLAAGGVGFAAGQITSKDIKDNTIQSRDVKNNNLTGQDLKNRSVPRTKLSRACATGEAPVFGGCVRRAAFSRSSYAAAVADCNQRNGRLPSVAELRWIATNDEFTWADGTPGQYEFSGEYTDTYPVTPIGLDQAGNVVSNSSALLFWHHCITY